MAFSPDGKWLASSGGSPGRFGEVQIWDFAKKKLKLSVPATFDTVYGPDSTTPRILLQTCDGATRRVLVHGVLTSAP